MKQEYDMIDQDNQEELIDDWQPEWDVMTDDEYDDMMADDELAEEVGGVGLTPSEEFLLEQIQKQTKDDEDWSV